MAERVAIRIEVEAGRGIKTLGDIEKEIQAVNHATLDLTESNIRLKKELSELEAQWASMPKAMRGMFGVTEKIFEELREKIKENNLELSKFRLKKQQLDQSKKDLKLLSDQFLHTTESTLQFGAAIGETAAGIMLLTGTSEENAHQIEKALGVMFAFEGVAGSIRHGIKLWNEELKNSAIIQKIATAGTKAYALAQGILNFVVGAGSKAMKLFRLALISTGIGAIVVGIGMLIANFGKVKEVVMDVIMTAIEPFRKALQWIGLIESDEESARKKRASAEKARAKERKKQIELEIEMLERLANIQKKHNDELISGLERWIEKNKALGKDTLRMEQALADDKIRLAEGEKVKMLEVHAKRKEILDAEITEKENQIKLFSASNNRYSRMLVRGYKKDLLELQNSLDQSVSSVKEADEKVKQLEHDKDMARIERENKRKEDEEKRAEERRKERKKRAENEKQAAFDLMIARKEADAEEILDARQRAEALINIENLKNQKELEDKSLTNSQKELIEFEHQQRIAEISQEAVDIELELEQAKQDELNAIKEEADEKDKVRKEELAEEQLQLAEDVAGAEIELQDAKLNAAKGLIAGLTEIAGENEKLANALFIADKALAIGEIIINTQREIAGIFAAYSAIPGGQAAAIPLVAAAKIRAATGIATIVASSIAKFKTGGGGASGVGGGSSAGSGSISAPSLSPVTNTSTILEQEPTQVFVTETDITNTQNKVAVIEDQATIQ